MKDKARITRIMAIAGTVLVGLPLVFMLITSVVGSIMSRRFLMDYFIPAELFFLVLAGALLLIWAAVRSRLYLKPLIWIIGVGLAALIGSQGIAMASGLGSGEREATGFWFILVIIIYALYVIGVIALFILGVLLSRVLIKAKNSAEIQAS